MPVEMIGWIGSQLESEVMPPAEAVFDHSVIAEAAQLHESAGFDRALVGYYASEADGFMVAAHAAAVTKRLSFLIAHRPGFVSPPVAARKFASLDHLTHGRASVHFIAGGSDREQAMDGDFCDHDQRYRRMGEYMDLMERVWTEAEAFDHEGEFYHSHQTQARIRCVQQPRIPVFGGGGSPAAIEILAPRVDVFMLWGEPLAKLATFMQRVHNAAGSARKHALTFSVSTRPILGRTEDAAWERAHEYLRRVESLRGDDNIPVHANVGARRLLEAARENATHDSCLWTEIAAATGAPGNTTALVGTPATVALALLEYYKLGASRLLIRGFDPLADAEDYGRELIPRLRELVAEHDTKKKSRYPS